VAEVSRYAHGSRRSRLRVISVLRVAHTFSPQPLFDAFEIRSVHETKKYRLILVLFWGGGDLI
jgi:hypothetical protein